MASFLSLSLAVTNRSLVGEVSRRGSKEALFRIVAGFFSVNGAVFVPPCRPVSYDLLSAVPYTFETKKPLERVCTSTKFKRLKRQNCRSGN